MTGAERASTEIGAQFWDAYTDDGRGHFVQKGEKAHLARSGQTLTECERGSWAGNDAWSRVAWSSKVRASSEHTAEERGLTIT